MAKGTPVGEPPVQPPVPQGVARPSDEDIAREQERLDRRPKMPAGQPEVDAMMTRLLEAGMSRYEAGKKIRQIITEQLNRMQTREEKAAGLKVELTMHGVTKE